MSNSNARNSLTRRSFLKSQAAMAAIAAPSFGAVTALAAPTAAKSVPPKPDYYDKLAVDKIVNAAGTYTDLTSAVMPPEVQYAVAQAAKHPVNLAQLQRNAYAYIAKRLQCEGALISCGATSAITLATAACIQAANSCRPTDIPHEIGTAAFPKTEIIVQKAHRYEYDNCFYMCGATLIDVVTLDDYKRAFTPNTVMTQFFNAADAGEISREDWVAVAHQHNVPCHMDAAADMPPIENLWKYTGMGFDLVSFSGGKGLRGPQNAGLLLGKKHLTDLAQSNNNPRDGAIGRGMKVAKEQIVGMVAAVDWILAQTDGSLDKEYRRRCDVISRMVKDVPTMQVSIVVPEVANHIPHLVLTYQPAILKITPRQARQRLLTGTPVIELNPHTGSGRASQGVPALPNSLVLTTWMLQPGEEGIVGRQIRKVLTKPESVGHLPPAGAQQPRGGRAGNAGRGANQ